MPSTIVAPSLVYSPGDPFLALLERLSLLLGVLPVAGSGRARYQPIWADDVADAVVALVDGGGDGRERYELAGPDTLSYEQIARLAARSFGRRRPVVNVPLPAVRQVLRAARMVAGNAVFATWDEVELMQVTMTSPAGTADFERLGVRPRPMSAVLGVG